MTRRTATAGVALLLLSGCASGPTLQETKASLQPISAGHGRLYVYRTYNYVGSAGPGPTVAVDGKAIGTAALSSVFDCDISAGRHAVTIGDPSYPEYNKYLDVDVPAGASVYLRVSTVLEFSGTIEDPKQAADDVQSMHVVPAQCSALDQASGEKAAAAASVPDVGDIIARGTAAEQQGDLPKALAIYTDALQRYVTRIEAIPDIVDRAIDVALRIRNVPIPDAAKKQTNAAGDAIRNAKTRADLAIARRDYANALAQAPWWSDAWFNLSKLDGQIGTPADVRRDLTWYLRAAPDAPDREAVQKQIDGLR